MTAVRKPWANRAYLDSLRPDPNSEVELALFGTYSADPPSIVAALLALVARDDDERDPTKRDLADAIESLRDKVRVVLQQGRLAKMRRTPRLAGVLDQFVREVPFDERVRSWHPKAALVRTRSTEGVEWRLWIGSRNLTALENRDVGLLMVGRTAGRGRVIEGAGDIAYALATHAELPDVRADRLAADVARLKWRAPVGIKVERLRISRGDKAWPLPLLPAEVDALTVVSPFFDAAFLNHVARTRARAGPRVLLSTLREIERLAATSARFGVLHALDAPDYPPAELGPVDPAETASDIREHEGEEIGRGLHAKLLHTRVGAQRRLWMGSANATSRAWTGRNVEIIVELSIDEAVETGLMALVGEARTVDVGVDDKLVDAPPEEDRLEKARAEVAANWRGAIVWDTTGLRLIHSGDAHPSDAAIGMEAGLVTGDLIPWPRGSGEIDLGDIDKADRTELVQLRLTLDGQCRECILRAPATPPFGVDRDRAAFMRLMGARDFLLWVSGLLKGLGAPPDDQSWLDDERKFSRDDVPAGTPWDDGLPTVEEMLGAWAKDPGSFERVGRRVRDYLPALLEQVAASDPAGHSELQRFQALWMTLRDGLGTLT